MSSACSTSYNIHEAQHLIPACPFNGCRYPVVADCLFLWLSWRRHQTIYSLLRSTHTRTGTYTWIHIQCVQTHRHTLHAGRCHGYIKAETANFDQLLTVIVWDSGDTEKWWNKVLPSLPPFILIGSRDTIFHPLWHNQYSSLVLMHVRWHTRLEWGARRNYEEIRRM